MHRITSRSAIPLLALALAGCGGGGHDAGSGQAASSSVEVSADAAQMPVMPVSSEGAITAIDAAIGDGRTMPPDWYGPSPRDIANRQAADRAQAAAKRPVEAAPPPAAIAPSSVDVADDAVTTG